MVLILVKMFLDVDELKKNCPEELKEDLAEITDLSRKFIEDLDIFPNQYIEEVKIDAQNAKVILFQMIARFITLIADNIPEDKKLDETKTKFEQDMGFAVSYLNGTNFGILESAATLTKILDYSGELRKLYDFIIYHPIIVANKKKDKDLKSYFNNIFRIVRMNVGVLGSSAKRPRIQRMISGGAFGGSGESTTETFQERGIEIVPSASSVQFEGENQDDIKEN